MKEWKAKWIMFETCPENVTPVFRRIFSLTKRPESASIDICGLGFYYLKINGKRVGEELLQPAFTAYDRTVLYNTCDITEFLTERQQQVYESVVLEDYSLSEVAEDLGISRQGVHDMIKRCNKTLEEYEQKLHLVEKFLNIRAQVKQIRVLAREYHSDEIINISNEILEEL